MLVQAVEEGGRIFRAHERAAEGRDVLVRMYPAASPDISLSLAEADYRISLALANPKLLAPEAFDYAGNSPCVVLEYFPGIPLNALAPEELNRNPERLLYRIGQALAEIHARRWAHLGLFPHAILAYPAADDWDVRLSGLAYAKSEQEPFSIRLEAPLRRQDAAFVAPELAGLDPKSPMVKGSSCDLYALGAVYSFVLEKLGLDHPVDHSESLRRIVGHLLEPDPGKRYRSIAGVLRDLETLGDTEPFLPGRRDPVPYPRFGFIGRELELEQLRAWALHSRISGGGCMVQGPAGSGKTQLAAVFLKDAALDGAPAPVGKFEENAIDGYTGFRAALEDFEKKAHLLPSEEYGRLKAVLETLPETARTVLAYWVPALRNLMPKTENPELTEGFISLEPGDRRRSLHAAVIAFFSLLCRDWKEIVLLLDDVHWAGDAALELCSALWELKIPRFFLLLTARPRTASPLPLPRLDLPPLGRDELHRLAESAFPEMHPPSMQRLVDLSYDVTGGNPLFFTRWIEDLHDRGFLRFDLLSGVWCFQETPAAQPPPSLEVAEFIALLFRRLSRMEQRVLGTASCFASSFNTDVLAAASGFSRDSVQNTLHALEQRGFVETIGPDSYRFPHDKLGAAACSLLEENERLQIHAALARTLSGQASAEQYVHCISLLSSEEERIHAGELELRTSRRVKTTGDFQAAWTFLEAALRLHRGSDWEDRYGYSLAIHTDGLELAFLLHKLDEEKALSEELLKKGASFIDTLPVYELKIERAMADYKLREAGILCMELLSRLGIGAAAGAVLRDDPSRFSKGYGSKGRAAGADGRAEASVRVFARGFTPLYLTQGDKIPKILDQIASIARYLKDSPHMPFVLVLQGVVECAYRRRTALGYRYGQQALRLVEQPQWSFLKAKVYFLFYFMIFHWKHSLKEAYPNLLRGFETGISLGDLQYASMCAAVATLGRVFFQPSLKVLEKELDADYARILPMHQSRAEGTLRRHRQIGHNFLAVRHGYPWVFSGPYFEEAGEMNALRDSGDYSAYYTMQGAKLILAVHFNAARKVEADFPEDLSWRAYVRSLHPEGMLLWYQALFRLRLLQGPAPGRKTRAPSLVEKEILPELERRARYCPTDYLHRLIFLKAELQRSAGRRRKAEMLYRRACAAAESTANYPERALLEETLGRFLLSLDRSAEGMRHVRKAGELYSLWGAAAKVQVLEAEFPLQHKEASRPVEQEDPPPEVDTLMSAGRFISGEIRLDALLEIILPLLMRYGGADYGYLEYALEEQTKAAEAQIVAGEITLSLKRSGEDGASKGGTGPLRSRIAAYVMRRGESVVLQDLADDPLFSPLAAPDASAGAVFCAPLLRDGSVVGYAYLQNTWAPGAFTANRVRTLELLLAQAMVSLENACFYLARRSLSEQRERLLRSEKLASLGILTATVAHEVNNPNHVIRLHAGMLKNAAVRLRTLGEEKAIVLAQEMEETAREIAAACERISAITSELKGIVRDPGEWKEVDLNEVVQSVYRLSQDTASSDTVPTLRLAPTLPSLRGDFGRLQQVVLNLLENALHAVEGGGGTVTVSTELREGELLLEVKDTGAGIPEEALPRVTEAFYSTRRSQGGTGLGLYVVSAVVKDHKGRLEISSRPGAGCSVRVFLPAAGP